MASDRQQFSEGLKKRNTLLKDGDFSVPADIGKIAIFCAVPKPYMNSDDADNKTIRKNSKIYRKEAQKIAQINSFLGHTTEIIFNPSSDDFDAVLTDPLFSDVITIGDGTLSYFYLDDDPGYYDWFDAICAADHLKTGEFVQRHCGHLTRDFSLPLGTLVTRNLEDVIAPAHNYFYARGLEHPDNALLCSPLEGLSLNYKLLKAEFSKPEKE